MNAEDPVMPKARTELVLAKCQAYGRCAAVAPEAFALDTTGHVSLVSGAGTAPLDKVLRGARSCPYRVITVFDDETGAQLFPPVRS